jgi:hypothetical protein
MADEKKVVDPALAGFYEAMEKTNAEKIANEMLAGISKNTSDSENFDVESGNEDATALGNDIQTCQAAFNTVCTYIGTRDLV